MELPKNEKSFHFEHVGEVTGHKWEGQFSVKCVLSLADKRLLEIEQSRLSMDLMNPTGNLSAIARVVSNLRVRVMDGPDWFNQSIATLDILDEDVMFELYGKCLDATKEWQEELKKKTMPKGESEGNPQKES